MPVKKVTLEFTADEIKTFICNKYDLDLSTSKIIIDKIGDSKAGSTAAIYVSGTQYDYNKSISTSSKQIKLPQLKDLKNEANYK